MRGRGFADLLDGRQEQPDEDGNDGDDDEQLDQRERRTPSRKTRGASHNAPPDVKETELMRPRARDPPFGGDSLLMNETDRLDEFEMIA
jgi:hypothetical protein